MTLMNVSTRFARLCREDDFHSGCGNIDQCHPKLSLIRGGHWDFRFCGLGYFLDRVFGFCVKRLRFWWSLRFADFSFFSIWFSVFVENMSGFSVLLSDVLFRFSYFFLFGFRFLLDLSGN